MKETMIQMILSGLWYVKIIQILHTKNVEESMKILKEINSIENKYIEYLEDHDWTGSI